MSVEMVTTSVDTFNSGFATAADAELTYMFDPMHFPHPVSKLFQSVNGPAFEAGFTAAMRSLRAPMDFAKIVFRHNYNFQAFVPVIPRNEIEAHELEHQAEESMKVEIPAMIERWEKEHLPRIKVLSARLETMNVSRIDGRVIPLLLDEVVAIMTELWTIHFKIVTPVLLAGQLFDELYVDLFGGNEQDAHALLVGVPSESRKAGAGLSDLAGAAKAAGLDKLLLATPSDQVMKALESVPMGEYFAAAIRDYLREYGLRQDLFDYNVPTWREDPTIAIANIQSYLRSGHDTRADHERALTSAVKALNAARDQIASYPEAVREQFEQMVAAARAANFLQEEHNFYIDQRTLALGRLLFIRLGERLVEQGVLAKADDIFMLTVDELKQICRRAQSEDEIGAVRVLVLEREADLEVSAKMTPPPFIGAAPAGPPPMTNPMNRAMMRFFGVPAEESGTQNKLKGGAGSRGIATGVARVARTLEDAKSLQPGEILVAITTMPAWTPLFGTAAAIVTETGGPLSHCAIVAREYGIPAVVGATSATRVIKSGDVITVDGTAGIVTIDG